jgi:tetrapyrrole methylase family protein/MazG family protein
MNLDDLMSLVRTLRKKCPWDRAQTLASLKNNLIEESYELNEAIEEQNIDTIKEEIGDILFLAFFMAQVFEEEKGIDLNKLITSTIKKYEEKHPHVFAQEYFKNQDELLKFWQKSKKDIFKGIPRQLPALLAAKIIQERVGKLGFDWESHKGPLEKVHEEIKEIENSQDKEEIHEEFGDLLFACVNLGRHLKIDPEDALRSANKKFIQRFKKVAMELKKIGKDIEKASLEEMDRIWDEIKKQDR